MPWKREHYVKARLVDCPDCGEQYVTRIKNSRRCRECNNRRYVCFKKGIRYRPIGKPEWA